MGLASTGTLGHITLTWSASSGGGLIGYNVYRSVDGSTWTQLNGSPITATLYDDAIPSPSGDGVVYQYRVTAKGTAESAPSSIVKNLHGTRLPALSAAGFTTVPSASPYVAEGTVVVNGGNLVVDPGTQLYVADQATVDLEQGDGITAGGLLVKGLLRVVATSTSPATFTAHRVGGLLANQEGFVFQFDGPVSFNPADGSGTLLQNAQITNLAFGGVNGGFSIQNGSPKLYNLHITANSTRGASYVFLRNGGAPIIQNCTFSHICLSVETDLRGTPFHVDHNQFRGGYYAISFVSVPNAAVDPGQIDANDFDGSAQAYIYNIGGSINVPLGGNFWNGGTGTPPVPAELSGLTSVHLDFTSALTAAPAHAGAAW